MSVQENPNGSGPVTSYTYDFGDRLRTVTQGSQARTFSYDALGRLVSAINPETGTSTYGYDGNGNLKSKTTPVTAPNATVTLGYDTLNRIVSKAYLSAGSDPNSTTDASAPAVTYCYDGSTAGSGCAGNPSAAYSVGRLTMTYNANSATSILAYDPLGRVLQSQQTPVGGLPYSFTYAYNLLDEITSETYPSGRVVTTSYDSAGRLSSVQDATPGATATTYGSGFTYAANNAVNSLTLGNGVVESTSFNTRFQPTQIAAGSLMMLGLSYGTGSNGTVGNNGNVQSATINWTTPGVNASFNQYFVYDPMNRLLGAQETLAPQSPPAVYQTSFACPGSGTNWCEPATYDAYGNRLIGTTTGLGAPANVPTSFNGNNQNSGGAWLYDKPGNVGYAVRLRCGESADFGHHRGRGLFLFV